MDVILVPGFWLDASSWDAVTPALVEAGHTVHPLTLPGLEAVDAPRAGIGFADHVAAVVAEIDRITEGGAQARVVLVGHSGGGAIIHAVAGERPDRIARTVFVDSFPAGEGGAINNELPSVGDDIPLPEWSVFDESDLVDLDEPLRAAFAARAIPEPRGVAYDPIRYDTDAAGRRFDVPATVIGCAFTGEQMRGWITAGLDWLAELGAVRSVDYIDLPTGHWPQFTKPVELGRALVEAVAR